MIKKMCK